MNPNSLNTMSSNIEVSKFSDIITDDDYIEEPWDIIGSYFKGHHLKQLVRHQVESYNDFVTFQIQKTIDMFNPVHVRSEHDYSKEFNKYSLEMFITFDNFNIYRPQIHENNGATKLMFPQEARLRNFTYASNMTVDINIKYVVRNGNGLENVQTIHKKLTKIQIGKLPIMLRSNICVLNQYDHIDNKISGECKMDPGGYFIINGSEKTCLGQERAAENQIYCFDISKNNSKWYMMAEIKSVPDWKCISPKQISVMISSKNNGFGHGISIQIPRIKIPVPVFIVFRALGVITDKDICEMIVLNLEDKNSQEILNELKGSIVEANKHITQESAIAFITQNVMYTPMNMDKETGARKKSEFALDVLNNDLFPHCETKEQKIFFLGYMVNKLLRCYFGDITTDDRDSYINKRIDLTGTLLNNLFRNYFNKLVKDMQKQIVREINNGSWRSTEDYLSIINHTNIYKIVKSTTIENGIKRALATGDFGIKHSNSNKVGVAQVLNRLTYISSLSHLRRINTPIDKSGKLVPPRKLHNTIWGFLCGVETPEGGSVGVVKNIAYMTHVTIPSNSSSLYDFVDPFIQKLGTVEHKKLHELVKVFVNGAWLGVSENPYELFLSLKQKKSKGIMNIYTSIVFDYKNKEIRVCNDAGRLVRPLLRVDGNKMALDKSICSRLRHGDLTWNDLLTDVSLNKTVIEYIDPLEQNYSMIAMKPSELLKNQGTSIYRYTHCEIHPSTIFGILASCVPFPEHNQSPRNTYQCLDINETVLLTNGNKIPIKDVKVGDDVICFNPETMETSYTKVVNQYIRKTDKKLFKIHTINRREIVATEDHKFMTSEGWKQVKDFTENDTLIGIMPGQSNVIETEEIKKMLIINEDIFRNKLLELDLGLNYINKQITTLESAGLLPLFSDNYVLPILARIFGFILADGSINIYERGTKYASCGFDFGTEDDVKQFENDLEHCGFNKCKYNKGERTFNNVTHTTFSVTHNGALPSLLIALGVTYGRKTETPRNPIPEWIMEGSKLVKREFVAGFQGGDGCKIRWNKNNKGYNYICTETSQQINPEYTDSLLNFMQQCALLLSEFEIEVKLNDVVNVNKYRNKVSFKISDKQSNLIKYYDNIGYRYAFTKNTSSFIVIEYLRYNHLRYNEHKAVIERIRSLHDEGLTNSYIANELNITTSKVSDIIRSYENGREISMFKLKDTTIEKWFNDVKIINGMVFMPVVSVVEVDNRLISDITVESENHSFIAGNNFLSSNCAMGKQAMGMYVTNFDNRMDKTAYVLTYPMRPLVDTRVMNLIQLNQIPSGSQVIVAIMTHTGYNQEDSILVNQGSIDRGLFQATIFHTEKDEDKKIHGDEEIRCKPDASKTKGMKFGNYNKVNSQGVIPEDTLIENRDIIIAKVLPIKENRNDHTKLIKYEDQSRIFRTTEESYVDKNYIERNGDGYNFCKVRIRTVRKPVIGDKFSSRHGQKGTCGNIIPECDMPYTASGLKPDLIINPHAIPSRMTIGQLKETILGKVLLQLGLFGDGTAFGGYSVMDICKELQKVGFESKGNEIMYNGLTGEQLETPIFIGPAFYQRLKHMVSDKQHSRSIGPMVNLTRQPAEGRSRDGGFRFGEMERDCMVSHGAARFTKERLYDASDAFHVYVCKMCGMIAAHNDKMHIHQCRTCDNRVDFDYVELPYACKLLFQELITMNVAPRIMT
jgi:DNA-directed RNA polymerase beta subunit